MDKTISQFDYNEIIREGIREVRDAVLPGYPPDEEAYLYTIWRGIAAHLEWEYPELPDPKGRTEVELIRYEIHRLVSTYQSGKYPTQPTLDEQIKLALAKPLAP